MAFIVGPVSSECCDEPCTDRDDPCDPCSGECPCECCPPSGQTYMTFQASLPPDGDIFDWPTVEFNDGSGPCRYYANDTTDIYILQCYWDEDDDRGWIVSIDGPEVSQDYWADPIVDCATGPEGECFYPDGVVGEDDWVCAEV